jgi:hypothetical protein
VEREEVQPLLPDETVVEKPSDRTADRFPGRAVQGS